MPEQVEFEYELPSGDILEVVCDITPGTPAKTWGLPEDCYPSEAGYVEIVRCMVQDQKLGPDFDPEGLFIRAKSSDGKFSYVDLLSNIEDAAWTEWDNQQS